MKRALCLLLALAMLLGISSAMADPKEIDGISDRKIKINKAGLNTDPEEMIAQGISPTTGRKLAEIDDIPDGFVGSAVTGDYRPILVQISNAANGVGVDKHGKPYTVAPINASYADVVYESVQKQEGTESRMTMLFSDTVPDYVGFVRSTRLTHTYIRQEWDSAFCTSGYSMADVPQAWRQFGVKSPQGASPKDPGLVYVGDYPKVWKDFVWRLHPIAGANSEVFMLADIVQNIIPKDHKAANHTWLFSDELPEGGDEATVIYVTFGSDLETNSRLEYDPDRNVYVRYVKVKNSPDLAYKDSKLVNPRLKMVTDGNGGQKKKIVVDERYADEEITFSNVIIQGIGMRWIGGSRPNPEMTGTGNADYFMGGRHYAGVWDRKDYNDRTVFYGEDGNEIKLQPGRTLIILMPYKEAWAKQKFEKSKKRGVKYE